MFNASQLKAIDSPGHTLIIAGPGTGKTHTLEGKAQALLAHHRGAELLAVTFTNESAKELRQRIHDACPRDRRRVTVGTFHSVIIRQLADTAVIDRVLPPNEQANLLHRALTKHPDIELSCQDLQRAFDKGEHHHDAALCAAHETYLQLLDRYRVTDFNQVIHMAVDAMKSGELQPLPCTDLFVDEFQDIDQPQLAWVLMHMLAGTRVTVVGDDDQSIYAFRSALGKRAFDIFLEASNADVVVLDTNYRSRSEIVRAAEAMIRYNNPDRYEKTLHSAKGCGGRVEVQLHQDVTAQAYAIAEAVAVNPSQWAVIARTNALLDRIQPALEDLNVPFIRQGGSDFWEQNLPAATLGFLKAAISLTSFDLANLAARSKLDGHIVTAVEHSGIVQQESLRRLPAPFADIQFISRLQDALLSAHGAKNDDPTLRRIAIEAAATLIGPQLNATAAMTAAVTASLQRLRGTVLEWLEQRNRPKVNERVGEGVILITMHGAKGRQYPCVWIPDMNLGVCPQDKPDTLLQEERRLAYVATTRAMECCIFSAVHQTMINQDAKVIRAPRTKVLSHFLVETGINSFYDYTLSGANTL